MEFQHEEPARTFKENSIILCGNSLVTGSTLLPNHKLFDLKLSVISLGKFRNFQKHVIILPSDMSHGILSI